MNTHLHKPGSFIGKYKIQYLIAAGTFGRVYMVTQNSKKYAMKEMMEPNRINLKLQMQNQIKVLAGMNHENIVKLYEVIREKGYVYLVMQFCQTDMKEIIASHNGYFDQIQVYEILRQVINGMNQLVNLHVVHRDLKPANILCSKGVYKIADFGLAKYIQDQFQLLKTRVGTPFYMAPQILKGERYTVKCDIWSLGVIFYQLIFGNLPWYASNQQTLIYNIYNIPLSFPKPISQKTFKLLSGMLAIEQFQRYSWEDLIKQFNRNQTNITAYQQNKFNKNTMQKLLNLEMNRISRCSFGKKVEMLKYEEKKSISGLLLNHFNEENRELCNRFLRNFVKS